MRYFALGLEQNQKMKTSISSLGSRILFLALVGNFTLWSITPALATTFGGAVSYSSKAQTVSFESRLKHLSIGDRTKLGLGFRTSVFISNSAPFSTAEASEIEKNNIDNVESSSFRLLATNAILFAEYALNTDYSLGLSIDTLGFSFGSETNLSGASKSSIAKPSSLNLFIFDKHDRGTLNSHFLVNRRLENDFLISFGLAHQFIEYRSNESFEFDNQRFRMKNDALVLVLSQSIN